MQWGEKLGYRFTTVLLLLRQPIHTCCSVNCDSNPTQLYAFRYSEQRVPILLILSYRRPVFKVMPMLTAPILAEFWWHQYNGNLKIYMRLMYAKVLLMYPFSSLLLMIAHAAWNSRLRSFVTASLMRWMIGGVIHRVIHRGPDFCPCSTPT